MPFRIETLGFSNEVVVYALTFCVLRGIMFCTCAYMKFNLFSLSMRRAKRISMKVLGGRNLPPYWERFDRLQQTAHQLGGVASPRGVFRFSSFEEFEQWKQNQRRRAHREDRTS